MELWPSGQKLARFGKGQPIVMTRFADCGEYHPSLIARMMALARDPAVAARFIPAFGGLKLGRLSSWDGPETALIDARARELFRRVTGSDGAVVEDSWGNIYRRGDYSMPHSHLRAAASIVYCVDPGEADPANQLSGQLCIVDPRLSICCQTEPGRMTEPVSPRLEAGTMIVFPGWVVHMVTPYLGRRPRLTLAWNLRRENGANDPAPAA